MVSERHDGRMRTVEVTCSSPGMADEVHRLLDEAGYTITDERREQRNAYCRMTASHGHGGPGFSARQKLLARLRKMSGGV